MDTKFKPRGISNSGRESSSLVAPYSRKMLIFWKNEVWLQRRQVWALAGAAARSSRNLRRLSQRGPRPCQLPQPCVRKAKRVWLGVRVPSIKPRFTLASHRLPRAWLCLDSSPSTDLSACEFTLVPAGKRKANLLIWWMALLSWKPLHPSLSEFSSAHFHLWSQTPTGEGRVWRGRPLTAHSAGQDLSEMWMCEAD